MPLDIQLLLPPPPAAAAVARCNSRFFAAT
eukprot:COSAG06_NODE_63783_length_261_cov_0.876543_1_plen_29_part_10